jgi:NADPH:quinone reductase-like Zn-dependent oxidoreductase
VMGLFSYAIGPVNVVDQRLITKMPAGWTFAEAASAPIVYLTAYYALVDLARLRRGESLLIHAAAGGVGSFGVQIAVARGARVIGTASEGNHAFLRGLGAEPVAYGDGVVDRIRALAPGGVDAVAEFVGGQLETSLAVLADGGRQASVADPGVIEHGGRWIWVRPDGAESARLAALADEGKLTVEVAQTFRLDEVAEAFALSQAGHVRGKLIIVP